MELYRIAKASNDKLLNNIAKAKVLSYTHGSAADADHYFQNVIPGWMPEDQFVSFCEELEAA